MHAFYQKETQQQLNKSSVSYYLKNQTLGFRGGKKKIPVKGSPVSIWEQDAMFPRSGPVYYLSSESQPDLSENGKEDISKTKMDVTSYFSRDQTIC